MTNQPLVSVITPFYNAERFLAEAIDSVRAQTYPHWELWLVDDGSTDTSATIAKEYAGKFPGQIHYLEHLNHANHGISATRNLGLRHAQGEFVALLDADDVWLPQKLAEQVAVFSEYPDVAMVYGHSFYWSGWTNKPGDVARDRTPELRTVLNTVITPPELLVRFVHSTSRTPCPSNVMVRRAAADRVGGFEDSFPGMYEDQVFFAKLCLQFPVFVSNNTWDKYRIHPDSCCTQAKVADQSATAQRKYLNWLDGYLSTQDAPHDVRDAVKSELAKLNPSLFQRVLRRARVVRRRLAPHGVILHYHRVIDLPSDPYLLSVSPQQFAEHLQVLKELGHPVSLSDLAGALQRGKLPRRAIAVTFDDGYVDNLQYAKPLLERHGVPATVFVTTGPVQSQHEFWWDELERLLLQPGELPRQFQLKLNGSVQHWELGASAVFTEEDCRRQRAWTMATRTDPTSRHRVFRALHERMSPLPDPEKRSVLAEIVALSSARHDSRPTHRALRADEIAELARGGVVEIGAHTITHTPLSTLRPDQQQEEIEGSQRYLEQILSRPVTTFAYPHGLFTNETVDCLRRTGMTCACATVSEPVRPGSDRFRLPRMLVLDWSGQQLAERLEHWFAE